MLPRIRVPLVALALMSPLATGEVRAQWGFGLMYDPNRLAEQTEAGISARSNIRAQAAYADRGSIGGGYAQAGGNAYYNNLRDPGYFERYDTVSRAAIEDRVARAPSAIPAPTPSRAPAPMPVARPVIPLGSFYTKSGLLEWPADAPTHEGLKDKRAASDAACLSVRQEVDSRGRASVASVTDAREKLLAYGRPALQWVRQHATPRVSDSFNLFLMSLYESLAQAANPPATKAG